MRSPLPAARPCPPFGRPSATGVFRADGTLDRRALGEMVFQDVAARRALEAIIHPGGSTGPLSMVDQAGAEGAEVVLLDVPLLFETGMDALCDVTWLITADPETRIAG